MLKVQTSKGEIAFTFAHYRDIECWVGDHLVTDVTHCSLLTNGKLIAGVGLCGEYDHFNKDKGRKLALVRALQNAKLDRKIRTEVWKRYHARRQSNIEYANSTGDNVGTNGAVGSTAGNGKVVEVPIKGNSVGGGPVHTPVPSVQDKPTSGASKGL